MGERGQSAEVSKNRAGEINPKVYIKGDLGKFVWDGLAPRLVSNAPD